MTTLTSHSVTVFPSPCAAAAAVGFADATAYSDAGTRTFVEGENAAEEEEGDGVGTSYTPPAKLRRLTEEEKVGVCLKEGAAEEVDEGVGEAEAEGGTGEEEEEEGS